MSYPETFSAEDPYAPRRRKSGCGIVALIFAVLGGCGLLVVACCGGGIYFAMNVLAEQVAEDLRDNQVIREHLGAIRDTDFVFDSSFAAGPDQYVIDATGTKGSGRLRVTAVEQGDIHHVTDGTLELPNGERYDLFPETEAEPR